MLSNRRISFALDKEKPYLESVSLNKAMKSDVFQLQQLSRRSATQLVSTESH